MTAQQGYPHYATVSRTLLACLPEHGLTRVEDVGFAGVSAGIAFLGGRYRPESMRTMASALRVLCRFLEESGCQTGLSAAVPTMNHPGSGGGSDLARRMSCACTQEVRPGDA